MRKRAHILIIGSMGQVGRALFKRMKFHYEIHRHDVQDLILKEGEEPKSKVNPENIERPFVMHICFPWTDEFIKNVKWYMDKYDPQLTVIHSCVKPGTTLSLYKSGRRVTHSPVVVDTEWLPNAHVFRKLIGYDAHDLALDTEAHLRHCFNTALIPASMNTEFVDLCLGVYNLTCRAVTIEIKKMFEALGMDYAFFKEMVHYSNMGFITLNKPDMLLQNMNPIFHREDYRAKLFNLIPDEVMSGFFKLAKKSYELEIQKLQRSNPGPQE